MARTTALIGPADVELTEGVQVELAEEPRASARAITLNLITGGLGSAMLSLPWSVAGTSLVSSVLIIAVVLSLNAWTISIVVRAADRYGVYDLGAVLGQVPSGLGPTLQVSTNICVWAVMFLCLVAYMIVIHDSSSRLLASDNRLVLVSLGSLLVLPLCFLSQRLLERTSCLAIAMNIYLFGLLGVLYVKGHREQSLPEACCILGTSLRGNFAMISVMFYAVIIQMCVLPMYKALEDRSPQKFDRILAVGFSCLFLLFSGFSCLGYLLIGPHVQSNILQDLPEGPASTVAQVGTILVVACVYPIMLCPMIAPMEERPMFLGVQRRIAVPLAKCAVVAAVMLTTLQVRSLGFINVLDGAFSAMIFVAIIPSVIGLGLLDSSKGHKVALAALLVGGVALSSLGLVFNDNYVADLTCYIRA